VTRAPCSLPAPGAVSRAALALAALLAACGEPGSCPPADLSPPERTPAFAVVSSDYFSTAIALLDADGELVTEGWLDSGTVPPGVVAALSGDVVIPTTSVADCVLTVIDRYPAAVVTFLDLCADAPQDAVISQLEVGDGFASNPHDVLPLGDDRALVSRHDPSPDGEQGSDLLLVDWRAGRIVSRIDLSELDASIDGAHVYARPSRMARLRAGGTTRALVGLGRMDRSFMVLGPGAVASVDPETGTVEAVELPDLAGCDEVDPVPGHPELAVATCGGEAFSDEDGRRATVGVAVLELREDGSVRARSRWRADDHPEQPVYNTCAVPLDGERIVVTAMGDFGLGLDDRVGVLAMDGAAPAPLLMEAGDAFVIGDGAFEASSDLLLIPDADTGTVRRFRRAGDGSLRALDPVDTAGCRGLPPREVRPLVVRR